MSKNRVGRSQKSNAGSRKSGPATSDFRPLISGALRHSGLTLMELAIVLAILAAMAAAAAVATEKIVSQRRFELTQATLDAARVAILGRHEAATMQSETPMAGFVADMGRPPLAAGENPATQAAELWSNSTGMIPFGLQTSLDDPEVSLACGWRGPYLRLPTGASGLMDGWGRPVLSIALVSGVPTPAQNGQMIAGMTSLGSDGNVGTSALSGSVEWSADLNIDTTAAVVAELQVRVWQRDATGDLVPPNGNGMLTVRLFTPNGSTGAIASLVAAPTATAPFATGPTVTFSQIPTGPKVLRAYFDQGGVVLKSQPRSIEITRSGPSQWELVLSAAPATPLTSPPMD